jgi:N utilization substance protein B
MLNRRILRAKALQSLYAYYKSEEANYNLALEEIDLKYMPDLNSMEPVDKSVLNKKKIESQKIFDHNFKYDSFDKLEGSDAETENSALDAYHYFLNNNRRDFEHVSENLIRDAEKIYDYYLWILQLIVEFARLSGEDPKLLKRSGQGRLNLVNNRIVALLRDDPAFEKKIKETRVNWIKDHELVYNWYKNLFRTDEDYQDYLNTVDPDFETDRRIVNHIIKELLFKDDNFHAFMESADLDWVEDRHVIKSMLVKTIKNLQEDNTNIDLAVLSNNWEEDKSFFKTIFEVTIKEGKEFDSLIAEKSKNWDIDRIALMDKIILKMAIGEMIHFPSIPVKVSINEYIELSKNFSTPKSKKFVNGILDVLSEDLKNRGIIKKSGRGLIDNK